MTKTTDPRGPGRPMSGPTGIPHPTRLAAGTAALGIAALLAACGGEEEQKPVLEIKTLSNRADLVSDGDVLVQLVLPSGATTAGLKADINGSDVTSAFAARADGRVLGVVSGLKVGENLLTVSGNDVRATTLTITNFDRGGPVYSGAQPTPFVCATPTPQGATTSLPAWRRCDRPSSRRRAS